MKIKLGTKKTDAVIVSQNLWKLIKPLTHPGTPDLYAEPIKEGKIYHIPIDEYDVANIYRPEKISDFAESLDIVCSEEEIEQIKSYLESAEQPIELKKFFPESIRATEES